MGETRKIVIQHFPVEKLPAEIRSLIEGAAPGGDAAVQTVTVTVEQNLAPAHAGPVAQSWKSFFGAGRGIYQTHEEAVEFIRALRDESDR